MKPAVARQGIVSLKIKDAAELYTAYMPFLKRGGLFAATAQRQAAETVLKRSADRHTKLLAEAEQLQKNLRQQTRKILITQEDTQDRSACELRNEIAQALIAIDLSLLVLRTSAVDQTEKLEKKIAHSLQLVLEFSKSVGARDRKNSER